MSQRRDRKTRVIGGVLLIFGVAGCGTTATSTPKVTAVQHGPQTYLAPSVAGGQSIPQTYTIDDSADTFSQATFTLSPDQQGPQVLNAGTLSVGQRGLRSLGITANYTIDVNTNRYVPTAYNPPLMGSFALELAGQAGGLVQLAGQTAQPMVAATACPALSAAQTYLFITLPAPFAQPGPNTPATGVWDPMLETAYGSVDVSSTGSTVAFKNIKQFTLPSAGGSGTPAQPAASAQTGSCAPTFFGNTIDVPGQLVITTPGNGQKVSAQAIIGIGSSGGLLVEDNGSGGSGIQPGTSPEISYDTVLGAGSGAAGLPESKSALDTGAVVGAQYLGFIYAAGVYINASTPTGASSHLASFGFASMPSGCATVAAQTGALIYGGDFTGDDPANSSGGYSNCDFAIDLGVQDAATNGLYSHATVWVGAGYAANASHATYSFPAVAIAGQAGGKYAIFLIGFDSTQPWAVYLLQTN